jgi:hypothetical protein
MTSLRRLRTQRALAIAGLVAVATPLLSSCGFDYATDRPNTIANGGYHIYGDVHVLAARVVMPSEGTGTFVATITVDPQGEDTQLTSISSKDGTFTAPDFSPVDVAANGSVNLFTAGGIPITGDFAAGDAVPVTLTFSTGEPIEIDAIAVKQCYEYADVTTMPVKQSKQAQAEPTGEPYTCDYASVPPLDEGH